MLITSSLLLSSCVLLAPVGANAEGLNYLLFAPGITGESTIPGYEKWIEIGNYRMDEDQPGVARPEYRLTVHGPVDSATIPLIDNMNSGPGLPTLDLVVLDGTSSRELLRGSFTGVQLTEVTLDFEAAGGLRASYAFLVERTAWQVAAPLPGTSHADAGVSVNPGGAKEGIGFLQIDGVTGGALAAGRKGWIPTSGFQVTLTRPSCASEAPCAFLGQVVTQGPLDVSWPTLENRFKVGIVSTQAVFEVDKVVGGKPVTYFRMMLSGSSLGAVGVTEATQYETFLYEALRLDYSRLDNPGQQGSPVSGSWGGLPAPAVAPTRGALASGRPVGFGPAPRPKR